VPDVQIPELRIYQRYLPGRKGVTFNGGRGIFQGQAELTTASLTTSLQLRSDAADVSLQGYRFSTNLDLGIKVDIPSFTDGTANVAGTYVRLDHAKLINRNQQESIPWAAALAIDEGIIDLLSAGGARPSEVIKASGFKVWLGQLDADFSISGEASNLQWINVLFVNPYDMAIGGKGDLSARLHIRDGRAAKDSVIKVLGSELTINVLDYVVAGDGLIELNVLKGGEQPDLVLDVDVRDGLFRRQDETEAFVEDVVLKLRAKVVDLKLDDEKRKLDDLYLQIPSARVTDMSIYNQYLPDKTPLRLLGGEANLNSYIHLQPDSAAGYVKLHTHGLRSRLNEQELAGELVADIQLSKWSARFDLEKGHTVWKKPVVIEAEASVEIKDSRPFVAIFSNEKGQYKWLEKMLTVEDIQGRAELSLENDQLVIPHAFVSSDHVDAGAKGIMDADRKDGVFYARFRKLDAVLKIKKGERNIDVMGARKTFTEYDPLNQ
jgi:hypothetical protein